LAKIYSISLMKSPNYCKTCFTAAPLPYYSFTMHQPSNKPKIIFLSVVTVLIFSYLLLELVSYLSLSSEEKRLPPSKLLTVNQNKYIEDFSLKTGCLFSETIIGHPVLGYVHRQPKFMSERCQKTTTVNNIGMRSARDLPLIKNPDEFAVMIVGGSVAEQFANYQVNGSYYFEDQLNKQIKLPGKKRFKIYNGALGGWAMPNQLHMIELYGDRLDAVVALDGYNEAYPVSKGLRPEQIFPDLYLLANSRHNGFNQIYLRTLWALQYGLAHKFIKHSYFFNVSYQIMVALFRDLIMSPQVLDEFTKGNIEQIQLTKDEAVQWSLSNLKRYNVQFHHLARINGIKSAQFLQPSRLYGKVLTEKEKKTDEFISKEMYERLESMYKSLAKENYPVYSLTNVFAGDRQDIYSDHIHYIKDQNNVSYGNEKIASAIAGQLKSTWKF